MNGIFAFVFLVGGALLLFVEPDAFLSSLLRGGEKAASLSLVLLSSYCVWLGFFKVLDRSGLSEKLSRRIYPLARRLFRSENREALALASANLSANLLGLPGAPTPLGVRAAEKFLSAGEEYGADALFVLNATSLQLLPTTVVALRLAAGSVSPADIFLPTLLSTLLSSVLGLSLLALSTRKKRARPKAKR